MLFPLLWIALSFCAGVALASQVNLDFFTWLLMAAAAGMLSIWWSVAARRRDWRPWGLSHTNQFLILLSLAALFGGAARLQAGQPERSPLTVAWYNGREYDVLVTGVVTAPPDVRDTYTNLMIRVEGLDSGDGRDLPVSGLMLVRITRDETYHYGERLRLRGQLRTPAETEVFSYRDYLARSGIYSVMRNPGVTRLPWPGQVNPLLSALYDIKLRSQQKIYALFPDPEAALLVGILLGDETGIPARLQQAFKDTGTAHIVAISGFNIAIIAGLLVSVFSRLLGNRRGAVAAVIGIAAYTILVGADASVVRAAIMGGLGIFARQVGRRQDAINTLMVVAAIMAAANPLILWDVGFQLSFAATLGLVLYASPMQQWAERSLTRVLPTQKARAVATPFSEYVLFTLAAQITTLPIMAYHFERLSIISFIVNPVILPAQPPVMIASGLALLASYVWMPLGQALAYLAWPFSLYTIRIVEWFGSIPGGALATGQVEPGWVVLFYVILLGATFQWERIKPMRAALTPALALGSLAILTLLVWRSALGIPDGRLHLTFLNVGTADAILIQTPGGRHMLINGGASAATLSDALGRRLAPFDRQLDWLVVASTQENQVGGLTRTLERFTPNNVLWAGLSQSSFSAQQLQKWLTQQSIPVQYAEAGQTLHLGSGATLKILSSDTRGAILLVEWNNFRALLPVGPSFGALETLADGRAIGRVDVLVVGEGGYAPVNPPQWVAHLRPQVAILSVDSGDPNGLPNRDTLAALEDYTLLRTDQNGWIHIKTDGAQMWVEVENR